ncbi:hypothetical protein PRIPAC_92515 [Pristionchus pacificus]|uniref:Uncharacterized protein n=1 Tax=Pristionchus pacificus TaxID=54126 RepID=A0A2A6CDH1_PRIPA|nr:hypothetical protein PRIPAC_92515 [Pristionchus pacificus]|eukprot:PDM76138.1 hypothetical protein PRIPAC_39742 [Pristionchus pacificus]
MNLVPLILIFSLVFQLANACLLSLLFWPLTWWWPGYDYRYYRTPDGLYRTGPNWRAPIPNRANRFSPNLHTTTTEEPIVDAGELFTDEEIGEISQPGANWRAPYRPFRYNSEIPITPISPITSLDTPVVSQDGQTKDDVTLPLLLFR